jgi:LPXTG-motif cell wall-anchored protein
VRILGCAGDPASTPTPNPTDGVDGSSSTPTPTGAVKALSTPSTGAGDGWMTLGGLLVMVGGGLLVAGKRGRRSNI